MWRFAQLSHRQLPLSLHAPLLRLMAALAWSSPFSNTKTFSGARMTAPKASRRSISIGMECSPPRNSGWLLAAAGRPCSSVSTGMAMVTSPPTRSNSPRVPRVLRARPPKELLPVVLARAKRRVEGQRPVGAALKNRRRVGRMPRSVVPETNWALMRRARTAQIPGRRANSGGRVLEVAIATEEDAPRFEAPTHCYADGSVGAASS